MALGTALVLGGAACSSHSGSASNGGKEVVIGGIIAETGSTPYEGTNEAISSYFDQLNAKGGVNGYKIKYISYDSAGSAQTNAALMTRLIGQGAVAVIDEDPQGAPSGLKLAQSKGIPVLGGFDQPGLYNSPTVYPVSSWAAGVQAKVYTTVLKEMGVSKLALLTINVPVGVSAAHPYVSDAAQSGLKVVSNEFYAPTQTDFTGYVSKEASAGAQAVVHIGGSVQGVAIARALQQQGTNAKLALSSGTSKALPGQVGTWGNGRVLAANPLLTLPVRPDVVAALKQSGNSKVDASSLYVALGWSNAEIAAEGIRLLGTNKPSPKAMITALNSISNFKGTYLGSPLTYGSGSHPDPSQCGQVQIMQNGAFVLYNGKSSVCWTGSVAPS